MYKYTPPKKIAAAAVIGALLFAASGVSLCFAASGIGLVWLFKLICAAALMLGIQITTRFILTSHTYALSDLYLLHESNDFVVERTSRGKRVNVCRLSLYGTAAALVPKAGAKAAQNQNGKISRRFNLCSNMFPREVWYFIFELNGETCRIAFEPDAEFVRQFGLRLSPTPPDSE